MSKIAAQRQVLATVSLSAGQTSFGIKTSALTVNNEPRKFAQVSGGEITASVEKVYRGGSLFPETLCAPAEIGDITLTDFHEYDETGDGLYEFLNGIRQLVGRVYFDISIKTYNCDIAEPGAERNYTKCLLVGITESDGDSSSGTPATYALTFSISGVTAA